MTDHSQPQSQPQFQQSPDTRKVDAVLAEQIANADSARGKIVPVLSHLLGNDDHELFSDEVVARVGGMIAHLGRQLALAEAKGAGLPEPERQQAQRGPLIAQHLSGSRILLEYCHALAIEWQLTVRLENEHSLDPVLSPLLQALVASDEPTTGGLGMAALTAQTRFAQAQRHMELPLAELPADIFHEVLTIWRGLALPTIAEFLAETESGLRADFDEGKSRIALLERLVVAMGKGVTAALSLEHAGTALFLSALAAASGLTRQDVIISTSERQSVRLLLALRATGLKRQSADEQIVFLHRSSHLPAEASAISPEKAAAFLDDARRSA